MSDKLKQLSGFERCEEQLGQLWSMISQTILQRSSRYHCNVELLFPHICAYQT